MLNLSFDFLIWIDNKAYFFIAFNCSNIPIKNIQFNFCFVKCRKYKVQK